MREKEREREAEERKRGEKERREREERKRGDKERKVREYIDGGGIARIEFFISGKKVTRLTSHLVTQLFSVLLELRARTALVNE